MVREHRFVLLLVALVALAGRTAVIALRAEELGQDRDAYLGIAKELRSGRGFTTPGSSTATAYRPPLYPLVLAASPVPDVSWWVAVVNVASGVGLVWATYVLGLGLGLNQGGAVVAAGLSACDPLLVRYASQPMTESLCALLVSMWLWQTFRCQTIGTAGNGWWSGVWFGLCALCRPTVWSAGGLIAFWWVLVTGRARRLSAGSPGSVGTETLHCPGPACSQPLVPVLAGVLGCCLVVTPWVLRNWLVFGVPLLTTTHGGYTLLLANNPEFYAAVVRQPIGAVWDGSQGVSQEAWIQSVQQAMEHDGVQGEVAADAWMTGQAWRHVRNDSGGFVRACALRQLWFWNLVPLGDARGGWPTWILWCVGWYYAVLWLLVLIGLLDIIRSRDVSWIPGMLLIAGFATVHLIYWTNARMRAPLVPILSLLAARGGVRLWRWLTATSGRAAEAPASTERRYP